VATIVVGTKGIEEVAKASFVSDEAAEEWARSHQQEIIDYYTKSDYYKEGGDSRRTVRSKGGGGRTRGGSTPKPTPTPAPTPTPKDTTTFKPEQIEEVVISDDEGKETITETYENEVLVQRRTRTIISLPSTPHVQVFDEGKITSIPQVVRQKDVYFREGGKTLTKTREITEENISLEGSRSFIAEQIGIMQGPKAKETYLKQPALAKPQPKKYYEPKRTFTYLAKPQPQQAKVTYAGLSQLGKVGAHLAVIPSGKGMEYLISYLPGGKTPTEVAAEAYEKYGSKPMSFGAFAWESSGLGSEEYGSPIGIATTWAAGGKAVKIISPALGAIPGASKVTPHVARVLSSKTVPLLVAGLETYRVGSEYVSSKEAGMTTGVSVERATTRLAADVTAAIAFDVGLGGKLTEKSPIKYGKAEIEGQTWKGIYWDRGPRSKLLIGRTETGFTLGTPTITLTGPYLPTTSVETALATPALISYYDELGASLEGVRLESGLGLMKLHESFAAETAMSLDDVLKETKYVSEAADDLAGWLVKKKDAAVYGSVYQKMVLGESMGRSPHDIDIMVDDAAAAADDLLTLMKKHYGSDVRISPGHETLIETRVGGKWGHAIDIHDATTLADDLASAAAGSQSEDFISFGFKTKPRINIGGVDYMPISEQAVRKGASSITPQKFSVDPAPHRVKDIGDFVDIGEFAATTRQQRINPFESWKGKRTEDLLDIFKSTREGAPEILEEATDSLTWIFSPSAAAGSPSVSPSIAFASPSVSGLFDESPSAPSPSGPSMSPGISPPSVSVSPKPSKSPSPGYKMTLPISVSPPPGRKGSPPSSFTFKTSKPTYPSVSPPAGPGGIISPPPPPPRRTPKRENQGSAPLITFNIPSGQKIKSKSQAKVRGVKTEYRPSFAALALGKKGRKPKVMTGIEMRPIVRSRKKKKKKGDMLDFNFDKIKFSF